MESFLSHLSNPVPKRALLRVGWTFLCAIMGAVIGVLFGVVGTWFTIYFNPTDRSAGAVAIAIPGLLVLGFLAGAFFGFLRSLSKF